MAILFHSRTTVVIFLLTLSSGMSQSNADESQSLFRYLGVGWGAGYHSYGSSARNAHGYCCMDRYSRPANCGCVDCRGRRGGQDFVGNHGYDQGNRSQRYAPPQAGRRPQNQQRPTNGPQNELQAPERDLQPGLPPLKPNGSVREALPKTNGGSSLDQQTTPSNSGTSKNPFGVMSHPYRKYKSVPTQSAPQQIGTQQLGTQQLGTQQRFRTARQLRQLKYPQKQNLASANYNRIPATSNSNYRVYSPQRSSTARRPPQQLNYNQIQAKQLATQNTFQDYANQRSANQQRSLREETRSNTDRSNVYPGIR